MAEVEFMTSQAEFMRGRAAKLTPEDCLIERMKIEDGIFEKYGVEMEHLLILKEEQSLEDATTAADSS